MRRFLPAGRKQVSSEPVAQSVEHVTFNHGVQGSSPCGLTNIINNLRQSAAEFERNRMTDHDSQNGSRQRSMIALGIVVFLFVIGWVLAHELYANGKLEDCLLSGRTNCEPVEPPAPQPISAYGSGSRSTSFALKPSDLHQGVVDRATERGHDAPSRAREG